MLHLWVFGFALRQSECILFMVRLERTLQESRSFVHWELHAVNLSHKSLLFIVYPAKWLAITWFLQRRIVKKSIFFLIVCEFKWLARFAMFSFCHVFALNFIFSYRAKFNVLLTVNLRNSIVQTVSVLPWINILPPKVVWLLKSIWSLFTFNSFVFTSPRGRWFA